MRAKTINEIRRSDVGLGSMGVGTVTIHPAYDRLKEIDPETFDRYLWFGITRNSSDFIVDCAAIVSKSFGVSMDEVKYCSDFTLDKNVVAEINQMMEGEVETMQEGYYEHLLCKLRITISQENGVARIIREQVTHSIPERHYFFIKAPKE